MTREPLYKPVRFPKREHGKIAKLKADPIHGGNKVRKVTQRHRKHETSGTVACKMQGCGGRYRQGEYYQHIQTLRHINGRYR